MAIRPRQSFDFQPTEWDKPGDKEKFYAQYIKFVQSGFDRAHFPKWFYTRLSMTFGHIAHYNQDGFYSVWFTTPSDQLRFLENALRYGCYGVPTHTYCDVESALQAWISQTETVKNLARTIAGDTEKFERATLAALKQKYPEQA